MPTAIVEIKDGIAKSIAPTLDRIAASSDKTTAAVEKLQATMDRSAGKMTRAAGGHTRLAAAARQSTAANRSFQASLVSSNTHLTTSVGKLKETGQAMRALFSGVLLAGSVAPVLSSIDTYTNFTNKIKQSTDSQEQFIEVQKRLVDIAKKTGAPLKTLGTGFQRIDAALKNIGGGQQESIDIVETLVKAFAVGGLTTSEMASALTQLTQSFNSGILAGEEFKALAEALPSLMNALAKSMGVPVSALRELREKGKITVADLRKTFAEMQTDISAKFDLLDDTVGRSIEKLKTAFIIGFNEFDVGTGFSEKVVGVFRLMAENIPIVITALKALSAVLALTFARSAFLGLASLAAGLASLPGLALAAAAGIAAFGNNIIVNTKAQTTLLDTLIGSFKALKSTVTNFDSGGEFSSFYGIDKLKEQIADLDIAGSSTGDKWYNSWEKFRELILTIVNQVYSLGEAFASLSFEDKLNVFKDIGRNALGGFEKIVVTISEKLAKGFLLAVETLGNGILAGVRLAANGIFKAIGYAVDALDALPDWMTGDLSSFSSQLKKGISEDDFSIIDLSETRSEIENLAIELNSEINDALKITPGFSALGKEFTPIFDELQTQMLAREKQLNNNRNAFIDQETSARELALAKIHQLELGYQEALRKATEQNQKAEIAAEEGNTRKGFDKLLSGNKFLQGVLSGDMFTEGFKAQELEKAVDAQLKQQEGLDLYYEKYKQILEAKQQISETPIDALGFPVEEAQGFAKTLGNIYQGLKQTSTNAGNSATSVDKMQKAFNTASSASETALSNIIAKLQEVIKAALAAANAVSSIGSGGGGGGFGGGGGGFGGGGGGGAYQSAGASSAFQFDAGFQPNIGGGFGSGSSFFSEGGYTGNIGRNNIAGLVHGNEFVMPADATNRYRPMLEAMRNGNKPVIQSTNGVKVSVNNYGGTRVETRQLSPQDIEVIVHKAVPQAVAGQLGNPNSRVSKSLQNNTTAGRRR